MIWRRAIHDTFEGRGQRTAFVIAVGSFSTFAYLYVQLGPEEAMLEMPHIIAAIIGTFVPLTLLFVWNLICAPYRVERDARLRFEEECGRLQKKLSEFDRGYYDFTESQLARVTERLRSVTLSSGRLNVIFAPSHPDVLIAAEELSEAIKLAGHECNVHDGPMFPHDLSKRGILVYFDGDDPYPNEASDVVSALEPLDRKVMLGDAVGPAAGVILYIARPPKP